MSRSILKALPGKLDIKKHSPSILNIPSCLLITFANSLDPNQARQTVGPDLHPNSYPEIFVRQKIILLKYRGVYDTITSNAVYRFFYLKVIDNFNI